jgi:hypothetical protein
VTANLHAAAQAARRDRAQGRAALNEVFRAGSLPVRPLDGRYAGSLVLLDVAPGLNELASAVAALWTPWKGKTFDARGQRGDNIFIRDSLWLAHLCWPLYRGYVDDGPQTYRAFQFRTRAAPGLFDPDRQVLKIDYDLDGNPALSIRRVLDEIVDLGAGVLLGKAHLQWWWGRWQTVAYFTLEKDAADR